MPPPDPLQLAAQLERLRLFDEAIVMLENATRNHPGRSDLAERLAELQRARSGKGRALIVFHTAMWWVLLVASWALVFVPFMQAALAFSATQSRGAPIPLWAIIGGLVALVLLCVLWIGVFLHLWFLYLRHVAAPYARMVELRLHRRGLEPRYSAVRKKYFPDA